MSLSDLFQYSPLQHHQQYVQGLERFRDLPKAIQLDDGRVHFRH